MASFEGKHGRHARPAAYGNGDESASRFVDPDATTRLDYRPTVDNEYLDALPQDFFQGKQPSREEEMTQAFDSLYGGQSAVSANSYGYEHTPSSYGDMDYSYNGQAGNAYSYSSAGKTQQLDYAYDRYGSSGNTYQQGYSNTSYVNGSGNAQVIGYAKKPGRQIDLNPKKTKRDKKRQAKLQNKQAKQARKQAKRSSGGDSSLLRKLIALLIIIAIPVCIYGYLLDRELAIPDDQRAAVKEALQPAGFAKPFYVLLLGSDSREGSDTSSNPANSGDNERSDVILLLRVDPWKDQITMVSVPRDTPYRASDGTLVKINETYNYGGAAETIRAVSGVTGVGINHYVEVGFSDLENIVDAIGGVTVPVNTPLSYTDALTGEYVTIDQGEQTLNGQAAQIFARARHEYGADQDMNRQNNVRTLFGAIFKGILHRPFWEIPGTVLKVAHYITTDMKSYNFATMALSMILHPGGTTIYSCTGPYAGDINYESGGLWLCYENPEGWANLMAIVDKGEDPSQYDLGY